MTTDILKALYFFSKALSYSPSSQCIQTFVKKKWICLFLKMMSIQMKVFENLIKVTCSFRGEKVIIGGPVCVWPETFVA